MLSAALPLRPAASSGRCLRSLHHVLLLLRRRYASAAPLTASSTPASPSQAPASTPEAPIVLMPALGQASPEPIKPSDVPSLRTYKPKTPGLRHLRRPINDHLWKGRPVKHLTFPKKGQARGGRNNTGRVTVRHRGGGHKRRVRIVDFVRAAPGRQTVLRIEYDPNRSAHLALLEHADTRALSYIVAADGMRAGDVVQSFRAGIPKEILAAMGGVVDPGMLAAMTAARGNCLPMHMIPVGTQIYNVGSRPRKGAVFCRSAGTYAVIVAKEERDGKVVEVAVKLQSGEIRKVSPDACGTIGVASNPHKHLTMLGKAGRKRWLGIRPTVRGVAMNAADHPHGGGRGKSKGNRIPVSPWGVMAKSGYKTRRKRNPNKYLVRDRPRNQGKRRKGHEG